jgi:hypothetical protein
MGFFDDFEKTMHLGGVERQRQHAIGARRGQEIGDETAADGDARRVLLVGARISIVGHDGRDAGGGGPARSIEHEQEFHEVLLDRRDERLDDEDVALAAVGVQLHPETVVAEAVDGYRIERQSQRGADLLGKLGMRAAAENPNLPHLLPFAMLRAGCARWICQPDDSVRVSWEQESRILLLTPL